MDFILKLTIAISVIIFCVQIGKQHPSLAGLIATMPLTGLIVLVWIYMDNPGRTDLIIGYTKGVVWGIAPTVLFFLSVLFCFKKNYSFTVALSVGFSVWLLGAVIHQWFLK
jgi:uncharacterized membrane protein (GlpM family)